MHGYLSEYFNLITTFIIIIAALIVGLFIYRGSELVSFHQQASQVIERSGNVDTAYLDGISKDNYHNLFYVTPQGNNDTKPLGHHIRYQIHGDFPINIFHKNARAMSFTNDYQATSQIRRDSQNS